MDLRAVIFVPALAASVIAAFVFCLFAAHAYLTVLQNTGSGTRDVGWAAEPILDHFWKVFYLAWLIGLWLGPAYFLGRMYIQGAEGSVWRLAVPLLVFWLAYPISQLSSLSASTIWLPLNPDVFARLIQKPGVTLGFLLLTAPVLALFGLAFHWSFGIGDQWGRLFIGAPLLVIAALVYARLIGRLAFALMYTKSLFARKKKPKDAPPPDPPRTSRPIDDEETPEPAGFVQPEDLPPLMTPDEGELTGYAVRFDDRPAKPKKRMVAEVADNEQPRPKPKRPVADEDEDRPYAVHEPEVQPEERIPEQVVKPNELEMKLLDRSADPKPPKTVWSPQLLAFLVQPDTIPVVVMLSGMCFIAGAMVRIARIFNPVG